MGRILQFPKQFVRAPKYPSMEIEACQLSSADHIESNVDSFKSHWV